jgi:hypothetical protein
MKETIVTVSGSTAQRVPINSSRFVSITALVSSSETGTLTFTARTHHRAQFEALSPDNAIDLTAPQTLNIKDTKIVEVLCTPAGVGSSEVDLKVEYFDN